MSNAYEEAKKLAREKARETTVLVSLSVLQDILTELRDANARIRQIEDRSVEPVENVRQIVTKLSKDER